MPDVELNRYLGKIRRDSVCAVDWGDFSQFLCDVFDLASYCDGLGRNSSKVKSNKDLTSFEKFCCDEYTFIGSKVCNLSRDFLCIFDFKSCSKLAENFSALGLFCDKVFKFREKKGTMKRLFAGSRISKIQKVLKKALADFRKSVIKKLKEFANDCKGKVDLKKFEEFEKYRARFLMLDEFFKAAEIGKLGEIPNSVNCEGKLKILN